jgi:putative oxidoreductase
MKNIPALVAGIVLGLCFLLASFPVLFGIFTPPLPPEGTAGRHFMEGMIPTGYLKFVKMFEFVGALVVMIPRTRNLGLLLLLLGPVIVNIIAFHALVIEPEKLRNPFVVVIIVCALFLFWDARKKFSGLLN